MEKKDQILILYEELFNIFLECEGDLKKQGFLLKNKKEIILKIENISKKYDEMINEIQS